jgi:hypothetical protein
MSSTARCVGVLSKMGKGYPMCKIDWNDAYKHMAVQRGGKTRTCNGFICLISGLWICAWCLELP